MWTRLDINPRQSKVNFKLKFYMFSIISPLLVILLRKQNGFLTGKIISTRDTRSHDGVYASNYICTLYIVYCTVSTVQYTIYSVQI